MRKICRFPQVGTLTLFVGFFVAIVLGGCVNVYHHPAEQTASAAAQAGCMPEVVEVSGEQATTAALSRPPVVCVAVDVVQGDGSGCSSGKKCSAATANQPCGMPGAGKTCKTLNVGGVCSCKCQ
jgi:hypothetical protein